MSGARPTVVAMHARTGAVALNVVTAALDVDPRTQETAVVFARTREEMARALDDARGPVLAAWSCYSPDFDATRSDLAWVKERAPGAPRVHHVLGGVHATAEPLASLRAGFDLVAIGEGEHTIGDLVVALAAGADVRDVDGTAHLDANGRLVTHGPGKRPASLDEFPACNLRHRKWNAIEITRGCVYACTFCQTPFMFKARFRHRSVEDVRAHVDAMARSGSRFVRFLTPTCLSYGSDDTTPDLAAVERLLTSVRAGAGAEAKIYFGTFPSELRPEHVTDEALAILERTIDNRTLVIGGQSGSDRILEETRRGHTVDDVVRAVERCVAHGFRPDVDFLLGLPTETDADRAASIALAERLVAMGARVHSHAFMPLPGTPLRDARPTTIDDKTSRAMARLESHGKAYGQWRRQLVTAERLVRARRGDVIER